jgi:hypothetical protein
MSCPLKKLFNLMSQSTLHRPIIERGSHRTPNRYLEEGWEMACKSQKTTK